MQAASFSKMVLVLALLAGIVALQYAYDAGRLKLASTSFGLPPLALIRTFDLGLHAAAAGFFWVDEVIFEVPLLKTTLEQLTKDLALVNTLDPRFSFPYYFTVLVLANTDAPGAADAALEIGERGVREGDLDWRVPFYLAIAYHLYTDDRVSAARNYDLAARSPGIPFYAKRFSENYGIGTRNRAETITAWRIIAEGARVASDEATLRRAKAYIERLTIFDLLEEGARVYKQKFGRFPTIPHDLVTGGILKEVPRDPLGFEFTLGSDGSAGIMK